ncbi:pectinesterase inhibitor 9-like [Wolffia australiana]
MASPMLVFLAAVAIFLPAGAAADRPQVGGMKLILASCRATEFPALCVHSLSGFAKTVKTHAQLTNAALSVSLRTALSAKRMVAGMTYNAAGDCLENLADTVRELRDSLRVLGRLQRRDVRVQIDNLKTWVSAALTDEDTCMDDLRERAGNTELRVALRRRVKYVALLTRNALALTNALSPSSH